MECAHEVVVTVEEVLLVVSKGDLAATILGEEHGVALLDGDRDDVAREGGAATRAHGDDLALGQLVLLFGLGGGVRKKKVSEREKRKKTKRGSAIVV